MEAGILPLPEVVERPCADHRQVMSAEELKAGDLGSHLGSRVGAHRPERRVFAGTCAWRDRSVDLRGGDQQDSRLWRHIACRCKEVHRSECVHGERSGWLLLALADRAEPREVKDGFGAHLFEHVLDAVRLSHVDREPLVVDFSDRRSPDLRHLIALAAQVTAQMLADKTVGTCHDSPHLNGHST
jgi:hypothetical protein